MNKRGGAFGAFNGVYGVMWFLGRITMGILYSRSLPALVIFGVVMQFGAAVMFFRLRGMLAPRALSDGSGVIFNQGFEYREQTQHEQCGDAGVRHPSWQTRRA